MPFTLEDAQRIAASIGIDFAAVSFDIDQFHMGLNVELEHGTQDPETDVTGDDPELTGKIALAHLREFPDYYTRLDELEEAAQRHWGESSPS